MQPRSTHVVRGMDVGALLHQVPDSVHTASRSGTMERRPSNLRTSQSGRRQGHATLCKPRSRTLFLASMFARCSTRYRTASTCPFSAALWSGVCPSCAQASQAGGFHTTRRTPDTHSVLDLDVGAPEKEEVTQLRHVTFAGGIDKLFVGPVGHLFTLCVSRGPRVRPQSPVVHAKG